MKKQWCIIFALTVYAFPVYAGDVVYKDTDTGIIVEYAPNAEEVKDAQVARDAAQEREDQILKAEEERKRKEEEHNAKWRALAEEGRAQRLADGEQVDEDH